MKFTEMTMPEGTGSGGSMFAKYNDQGALLGVFRGDPLVYRQHGFGKQMVLCGEAQCEACDEGDAPKYRFRLNLIVEEGGQQVAKIFEGGVTVYKQLKALADEGYDLHKTRLKISKTGKGQDTTYTVMPAAKPVTEAELRVIANVPLKDVRPRNRASGGDDAKPPF